MFEIENLGTCTIPTPISADHFIQDGQRLLVDHYITASSPVPKSEAASLELAGPRETIYFDPSKVKAAVVTCGGLSPGLNDVIRAVVMELFYRYGVSNIIGVKFGFQGLISRYGHPIVELTPNIVKDIHMLGGSILASSRGKQDIVEMVDSLLRMNVNLFFCIGGDGTMKATKLISEEIGRRNLKISVIGIPKTIDNDLNLIDKTFGFDTAISEVVKVIQCAHVEAKGAPRGIGLVKIMGRESGHIAVSATLANNDVNFALIPEVPFDLKGEQGFLAVLEERLRRSDHALILVSEGAGQNLFSSEKGQETDASGNLRLYDIGVFLKNEIESHFQSRDIEINIKYIDPSYIIRSVPANASDSIYCTLLGQYAVHAGMAGKTGMVVGLFNNEYVHLPLESVTSRKKVNIRGNLWMRTLEATGQPRSMKN